MFTYAESPVAVVEDQRYLILFMYVSALQGSVYANTRDRDWEQALSFSSNTETQGSSMIVAIDKLTATAASTFYMLRKTRAVSCATSVSTTVHGY